ncbi:MAG: hypothetical protein AB7F86_19725 [Bdellovibrionales bacterium]
MDRWLNLLPKNMIAFLAIGGGILAMFWFQPPHSVCDSQLETLRESQKFFLFEDPKMKKAKTSKYERLRDDCKAANNPGGCFELFQEIKILLHDLDTLPQECRSVVGDVKQYKDALWQTAELLILLAWGEKAPEAYHEKFKWLETADISLFCSLKNRIGLFFGDAAWTTFRERMMTQLPGAKDLPRNQVWDMSLLSENCDRYP